MTRSHTTDRLPHIRVFSDLQTWNPNHLLLPSNLVSWNPTASVSTPARAKCAGTKHRRVQLISCFVNGVELMGEQSRVTFRNNGEEHTCVLGAGTVRMGRHEDNDLVLDNPYISRYHAEIFTDGSNYLLRDLGSTSGTFANGERITQRRLHDGDTIRLGRARGVEFVFHSNGSDDRGQTSELKPLRVIAPEETLFINTARLPHSGDLAEQTIERLRALYEFTTELLEAHSPMTYAKSSQPSCSAR